MITSWSNFTFWKNKTIQARRKIGQIIKEIMNERREKRLATRDLLGYLLNFNEDGKTLKDDQIVDNVIGVLFAAQDTAASLLTWILKYITDLPHLLDQIKVIILSYNNLLSL